jgi:hypothetical protein
MTPVPPEKELYSAEKIETLDDTAAESVDLLAEKKLLRKCDLYVLPPLFVLFLLAFLDRTNIGIYVFSRP